MNEGQLITKAKGMALEIHKGQPYLDKPYEYHLTKVFNEAVYFRLTTAQKIACWLHDAPEDQGMAFSEIAKHFGWEVADLVFRVTDEPGEDRVEKKLRTYVKLAQCPEAIQVKICDRIANIQACIDFENKGLYQKYLAEQQLFSDRLFHQSHKHMWVKLWLLVHPQKI